MDEVIPVPVDIEAPGDAEAEPRDESVDALVDGFTLATDVASPGIVLPKPTVPAFRDFAIDR
jgi:hypothetical protein